MFTFKIYILNFINAETISFSIYFQKLGTAWHKLAAYYIC